MEKTVNAVAFYTSRVDEDGNEIEIRQTARTFEMPMTSTRSNVSSRTSSRSIHYVNPAVYIEKNVEDNGSQASESGLSLPSMANSDIVPPLDLQSEENYPTRRDGYTFSYRNHCEPVKLNANPDIAYENWLSAKRKILSDEAARRKREQEAKEKEREERKRVAEEKYVRWLESKRQEKLKQKGQSNLESTGNKPPADEFDTQTKIEEWQRNKRLEEERRREIKKREKEIRQQKEEKRRQLADEAWQKWIAEAAKKPKPVPLNRGIFTLRGTISDIYINPNEWRGGDEP